MTLKNYFRLIVMVVFQPSMRNLRLSYNSEKMTYDNHFFYCPKIYCKDGFNVSLQINNGNYASSENGYRTIGIDWKEIEFGFPSMNDIDMWKYSEEYGYGGYDGNGDEIPFDETNFDVTETVGRIPIDVMQSICEKHGGIDWDLTLSEENANNFLKL